ncbi:MAG: phosphodiester glycosidase family protein, partial [Melioribacteraceae bacterium]|nr:phosphodiester glycosidase family protein [Melioribacteraceae bacterium]
MKKILFIIVLFGMSNIFGQTINWLDITNLHDLPDGVKLYEGSRTSPALKIYYYDVDLNNNLLAVRPYISNNIKTVPNFAKAVGAYGAINGGYFATGSANSYSSVIYPNEVKAQNVKAVTRNSKSYPVLRSLFSQKTDGSLSVDWIYHFGATLNDLYKFDSPLDYIENDLIIKDTPSKSSGSLYSDILTGIGGGPTLIKNGEIKITYNEEIMWGSGVGLTNRDPRSAVGFTEDNHVIMIVANGRLAASEGVSLNELSEILLSLGCIEAMNLDGGGSSQLSSKDSYISIPSLREVPSILAIVHKDSLKIPSESNWEEIIDTEDSNANIVGGSWFESANQGYYGESPSILSPLGTGENYCSYEFNITKSGNYEVSGWWVAASNRCKNTPYIILSSSFSDTIYVNQTENGSSWFPLGEYDLIENSTLTI